MRWLRRVLAFIEPSLVAVALAAIAIGALDAARLGHLSWSPLSTGFIVGGFGPPLLVVALAGRAALAAWWPTDTPLDASRSAGLFYVVAALVLGVVVAFNATYIAFANLRARVAAAFISAVAVAVLAIALIGLAPLVVRLLSRAIGAIERRLPRRLAISLVGRGTPMVLIVAGAFVGWAVFHHWLSPRLEYVDFAWLPFSVAAATLIVGVHAVWPLARRWRGLRWAELLIGLLIVGSVASATVIRYSSPRTMLELWGESAVASEAIETLVDLAPLHDDYGTDPPVERRDATRPDIVVITVDTWRADRTPGFGSATAQMPRFAEFAKEGVKLTAALTPSNNTRRSLPAIMMGIPSAQVRGRIRGWGLVLDPRHSMLADYFRSAGYQTAGFFCCKSLFSRERGTGYYRGIETLRVNTRTHELVEEVAAHLEGLDRDRKTRKPFFVWIHLIEPHRWNRSRKQPKPRVARARYDRTLVALDPLLGQILDATTKRNRSAHTVVALTSDHGEGLGDHNILEHARGLYDAIIRVPFVVRAPGIGPTVIDAPVSVTSLAPTLLDLAGFVPPKRMRAPSLAPLIRGTAAPPREVFSEQIRDRSVRESQRALIRDGFKLISGPGRKRELYDRKADPAEKKNIATANPRLVRELSERINELRKLHREPAW